MDAWWLNGLKRMLQSMLDWVHRVENRSPRRQASSLLGRQIHIPTPIVTLGAAAFFQVSGSGLPLPQYQWQRSNDSGATWIDLAGAMAAHRHSRQQVVTASIDHLDFLVPVHVGDLVILRSSVNRAFKTSMEVGVKVWVENYRVENLQHVSSAHLTFVAVDAEGNRLAVPPVVPETAEEKRRFEDAGRRRELRRAETERRQRVQKQL